MGELSDFEDSLEVLQGDDDEVEDDTGDDEHYVPPHHLRQVVDKTYIRNKKCAFKSFLKLVRLSIYKAALLGCKPNFKAPIHAVGSLFKICKFYGGPCAKLLCTGKEHGLFPDGEKSYDFCHIPQPVKVRWSYFDLPICILVCPF